MHVRSRNVSDHLILWRNHSLKTQLEGQVMNFSLSSLACDHMHSLLQGVKQRFRQWTKPGNHALVLNGAMDLTRSKLELVLENMLLRQQLIVMKRQLKRPQLSWRDRTLFILLSSRLRTWKQALVIVQPDTVLRWHRDLFRWVWTRKSRPKRRRGRQPLIDDIVPLIKQMAQENLSWGAERIRGEPLKLGIRVSKSTIQRYIQSPQTGFAQTDVGHFSA
jgi:putative transposase